MRKAEADRIKSLRKRALKLGDQHVQVIALLEQAKHRCDHKLPSGKSALQTKLSGQVCQICNLFVRRGKDS